jgi:hypothetical protein
MDLMIIALAEYLSSMDKSRAEFEQEGTHREARREKPLEAVLRIPR